MLNFWKQVVGDSDSSYSSPVENREGARVFSQRNNRSRGRTTTTSGSHNSKNEDKSVEILLSQFPPYGTFSQNRRNQVIFDSDDDNDGDDGDHDNDDYKIYNKDERISTTSNKNDNMMTVTDDDERSHHQNRIHSSPSDGNNSSKQPRRKQGRRASTRTQRYNKVEEDDESRSVASYRSYNSTSIPRINTVVSNHGDDVSIINVNPDNVNNNNDNDSNNDHRNEDSAVIPNQTFLDWEDDDEMNLWHKKKVSSRNKRISSSKRKTRRHRKGKRKYKKHHEANIFFWEKRQEWVDQGPKGSKKVTKSTSRQIDLIPNTSYASAPPSPGVTTASTSTQDTTLSPKRKYSPRNTKNDSTSNNDDEFTSSSLLSESDYDSDSSSSDNTTTAHRNDIFKHSAIFNQHSNNTSQNAESQSKDTSSSIQTSKGSSKDHQHHYEEKQHWMPDKLCKQCYSCDVPFSVFRRRHHCRICGQVFCSTCSAYFVEIGSTNAIDQQSQEKNDQNGRSLFLEKVASVKLGKTLLTTQSNTSSTPSGKNNADVSKVVSSSTTSGSKTATSTLSSVSARTVRVCKMCNDQLSTGGGALLASQHQLQAEELNSGLSKDIRDTKGSTPRKLLSKSDSANEDEVAHKESPLSASNHMRNFSSGTTIMSEKQTSPSQSNESSMSNLRNKFFPYKNSPLPSTTEETDAADPSSTESKIHFPSTSDTVLTDSNITEQFAGHDGSGLDDDFHNLNMVKKKLDEERMKRELKEQEEAQAILAAKAEAEAELQKNQNQPLMIGKRISSTVSKRFGRLAEQAAREPQLGDGDFCDEEAKLVGTGVKIIEEEEEVYGLDTDTDEKITKNKTSFPSLTTDEELLNEYRRSPSNGLNDKTENDSVTQESSKKIDKITNSDALKQANMHLGKIAADHLERMGRELLQSEAPLLIKGKEDSKSLDRWVDKLMTLATKCCATVESNIREGDLLDIRPYCKIKGMS